MTATIQLTTITAAIAAVNIDGLTIYDLHTTPDQISTRSGAAMFPNPISPVTEIAVTDQSFGAAAAEKNMSYKLNYFLAFKSVEAGRMLSSHAGDNAQMVKDIIGTFATTNFNLSGAVDFSVSCPFIGQVEDPAGNKLHGAQIVFDVLEFIQ